MQYTNQWLKPLLSPLMNLDQETDACQTRGADQTSPSKKLSNDLIEWQSL